MPDIRTIDQRIRARSDDALRGQIQTALEATRSLCRVGHSIKTDAKKGIEALSVMCLINMIEQRLFEYHQPKFQERALESFLGKLEELQCEVDCLRATIDR